MEEVPVHRADQGTAIGRHRGHDQEAHSRQLLAQRRRIHPPVSVMMARRCGPAPAALASRTRCSRASSSGVSCTARFHHAAARSDDLQRCEAPTR